MQEIAASAFEYASSSKKTVKSAGFLFKEQPAFEFFSSVLRKTVRLSDCES